MTPLLLGALASLAEVHPHFAPRAQLHPADVAQVAAAHPLDLGPLHEAMRGGLTGLRNKLATQLADLHKLNLSEPGERGSGPLHPQEGRALDAHFDRLTHRLLGMEHSLAASHLQDPAHRATAAALDRIVEQTRGALASVSAQTPAVALAKTKATLERLKRTLDSLPRVASTQVQAVHDDAAVGRVQCPQGVAPDLTKLAWQAQHEPRLYAKTQVQAKDTYLFVIVPPHYGSTALLSILASSPQVGTLCKSGAMNCEGWHTLVRDGLMTRAGRWDRDLPADWVQAVAAFEPYYPKTRVIRVEKSPNFIVKTQRIARQLSTAGHDVRFVVMSRSPCFVEAGGLAGAGVFTWPWEFFAQKMLQTLALTSSGAGTVKSLHVRYEDLMADPYKVTQSMLHFMPELGSLDPTNNSLADQGGVMNSADRAKSVVSYLREHRSIGSTYDSVSGKYRGLMQQLGYPAPAVSS